LSFATFDGLPIPTITEHLDAIEEAARASFREAWDLLRTQLSKRAAEFILPALLGNVTTSCATIEAPPRVARQLDAIFREALRIAMGFPPRLGTRSRGNQGT
jgi:hypothetical protein